MSGAEASLPVPDAPALAHSQRLVETLSQRMHRGPVSFAEYMHAALYEPGLGYYMSGAHKFGGGGDFVTAPEVSALFGQALAVQCHALFEGEDGLERHVLEFGAGSGALAVALVGALDDTLHYSILEPSPDLQARQRERLIRAHGQAVLKRVDWLTALPARFDGVMIANEVVDAMPVERFIKRGTTAGDVWQILATAADPGDDGTPFKDGIAEPSAALVAAVLHLESELEGPLPAGYASEVNLLAAPWLRSLADTLGRGVLLIADYGYPRAELYRQERGEGTLACYYRHRAHGDPYRWPGLQDITAHVDFTALAEAGTQAGLALLGYSAQATFLLGNDLMVLAERRMAACERELDRMAIAQQVKTLTLPGEMGERFQVIAFGQDYDCALRGFTERDLTHRL